MRKLVTLILTIISFVACTNEPELREEIIERYVGGQKKVIAVYQGAGTEEVLIKQLMYDSSGELIKKVNLITNVTDNYIQLNKELLVAEGLKKYLQGSWKCTFKDSAYSRESIIIYFKFNEENLSITYIPDGNNASTGKVSNQIISYQNDALLTGDNVNNLGEIFLGNDHKQEVDILSKNSYQISIENFKFLFNRTNTIPLVEEIPNVITEKAHEATQTEAIGSMIEIKEFVVNITSEEGRHYVKAALTIELDAMSSAEEVKKRMPYIRDSILLIVGNKTFNDLKNQQGKKQLKADLIAKLNSILSTSSIKSIYFTNWELL